MPDRGTQPPSLRAASPGVRSLNSSSGGGDDKCGCNTTPARTYAVSPCANLTVETGHFPSCPLIEIRRPCNSSSQTFSTVPAFPSVRITALPTSSVWACSNAPRIVDARTFAVGMGDTESHGEAGRGLHPKVAKVVTGARQTGVKDRNFAAPADDFGARNAKVMGSPFGFKEAILTQGQYCVALALDTRRVPRNDIAIERCAELRRPNLRVEIHAIKPKALFKSVDPLEIVHQAPQEIAANRHALGSRTLQLREIIAQVHDPIEIIHATIGGQRVGRAGAVLADVDRIKVPDLRRKSWHPVDRFRADPEPIDAHVRKRSGKRQNFEPRRAVGCDDVVLRCVNVQANEIDR